MLVELLAYTATSLNLLSAHCRDRELPEATMRSIWNTQSGHTPALVYGATHVLSMRRKLQKYWWRKLYLTNESLLSKSANQKCRKSSVKQPGKFDLWYKLEKKRANS